MIDEITIDRKLLEEIYAQLCGAVINENLSPEIIGYHCVLWETKEKLKKLLYEERRIK